jgi:hypothetical protein
MGNKNSIKKYDKFEYELEYESRELQYIEMEKLRTSTGCEGIFKNRVTRIAYPCANILDKKELISLSNYKYLYETFYLNPKALISFNTNLFDSLDKKEKMEYLRFFHNVAEKTYNDMLIRYYPLESFMEHDYFGCRYLVYFENIYYKKEEKDKLLDVSDNVINKFNNLKRFNGRRIY